MLAEYGSPLHAKDVFVLDLEDKSWVSLNKSRGKVISNNHNLLRPDIVQATSLQQTVLEARGVLIEVDDVANPTQLKVSKDGVRWDVYSMETITAQKLWAGWQEGVYISYIPHSGQVLYAKAAHQPKFNSLEVLKELIKQGF